MKKTIILLLVCLLSISVLAENEPTLGGQFPTSPLLKASSQMGNKTLYTPSSSWNSLNGLKTCDLVMEEGGSLVYSFSPVYQLSFGLIIWNYYIYFGFDFGFNLDRLDYSSTRPSQQFFNPFSYNTISLGFKIGPLMLGCNLGYTWDAAKAHWLYNFTPGLGLIASLVNRVSGASSYFFDGVYFMWGPEIHIQLWNVMVTGGYHIYPNLDMNNLYLGLGLSID